MDETGRTFHVDDLQALAQIVQAGDFAALVGARVKPDHRNAPKQWNRDLPSEWTMLLRQFGEGTALAFALPILTPLLRRGIAFDRNIALFHRLWDDHGAHLLVHLPARWLVSACDTMTKDPRNAEEQAWAFAGAMFMKTIQLYETELLRYDAYPDLPGEVRRVDTAWMNARHGRVMLFDGISPFNIRAEGDLIDNLQKRLAAVSSDAVSYRITQELFRRAFEKQTVYRRLSAALKTVAEARAARAAAEAAQAPTDARGVQGGTDGAEGV